MTFNDWADLHDKEDYTKIVKSGKAPLDACIRQYQSLCDEMIEKHGLSKEFKEYLRAVRHAIRLYCKYLITGDRFIEFEAGIAYKEAVDMQMDESKRSLFRYKMRVQKNLRFAIPDSWTIDQFYYFIDELDDNGESDKQ